MSTILVIGGGGYLGTCICRHFRDLSWEVISVGNHQAEMANINFEWQLPAEGFGDLLERFVPQLCVNAAGRASVAQSMIDPFGDFRSHPLLSAYVLDAIRALSPGTRFLLLSSASVYGNPSSLPITEDCRIAPISPYGYHKHIEELLTAEYASIYGIRTAVLRIFSAYGEGLRRQVIWDLLRNALSADGRALHVKGTGKESRDFIHGSDVARAVMAIATSGELVGECYNVASGVEVRIRALAEKILRLIGKTSNVVFDAVSPPGYALRWHADITRLRQLAFEPRISLCEGLSRLLCEARQFDGA